MAPGTPATSHRLASRIPGQQSGARLFLHAGRNRACHEQFFAVIFHDPQQAGDTGREVEELEHVPSQLNQGDSLGAKDERVYRH